MRQAVDVAIIGAGASGLMAAAKAAAEGVEVAVLSKGYGATVLSTGMVDLMGYTPEGKPVSEPLGTYGSAAAGQPYSLPEQDTGNRMSEAITLFDQLATEGGLPYQGYHDRNGYFPTSLGTAKPSFLAPVTAVQGNLLELDGKVLVVGFKEYPAVAANFIASLLNDLKARQAVTWASQTISLPFLAGRRVSRGREIAELLDREENLATLTGLLAKALAEGGYSAVALPPVIGFKEAAANIASLQSDLKLKVFELLPGPHSVPGQRLTAALIKALAKRGVEVEFGLTVKKLNLANGNCVSAEVWDNAGSKKALTAASWVVATGDLVGGGLKAIPGEAKLSVPVLGLQWDAPAEPWATTCLIPSGHQILREGVRVDGKMRPLAGSGKPVASNIFAAGALLAGYDYTRQLSGMGVAILTGYLAGIMALQSLAGRGGQR